MADKPVLTAHIGYSLLRATVIAAAAAEAMVGRGDEQAADEAAGRALQLALNDADMIARIVVGDGDAEALLHVGETLGAGGGPEIDIAIDALEGTTQTAKAMPGALVVVAAAPSGGLLKAPDIYMDKLAIGPGYAAGVIDLDAPAGENATRLAKAKGVDVRDITVCVLDRPRHDKIIADLRRVGVRINLIPDGDVAGVINTAIAGAGIDMYVGQGGAPEGVLAAAALKCVGGQMQARLVFRTDAEKFTAQRSGLTDLGRRYELGDLVAGETIFAATGVTSGGLLDGVKRVNGEIHAHSMIMSSVDGTTRKIRTVLPAGHH
jgi:fructose-1,6-bisphosphatase II / sedoheptulose-1,7-bisphosphatase